MVPINSKETLLSKTTTLINTIGNNIVTINWTFSSNTNGPKAINNVLKIIINNKYALDYHEGKVNKLDEETFSKYLFTSSLPEVDLIIRTANERRLSNFLLWQCAYAEFVFVDELWPEFSNDVLNRCIEEYNSRKRNFGGRDETKNN